MFYCCNFVELYDSLTLQITFDYGLIPWSVPFIQAHTHTHISICMPKNFYYLIIQPAHVRVMFCHWIFNNSVWMSITSNNNITQRIWQAERFYSLWIYKSLPMSMLRLATKISKVINFYWSYFRIQLDKITYTGRSLLQRHFAFKQLNSFVVFILYQVFLCFATKKENKL